MDLSLKGRRALVCGASQGIGKACAMGLAMQGAEIVAMARSEATLKTLLNDLPNTDEQRHSFISIDLADQAALFARLQAMAPVEILINNTGGPPSGPAASAKPEDYLAAFNQHLIANQILMQSVLPGMRRSGYGRIINIISTSVKEPIRNLGVSNTIRAAVASWAKTLAGEVGADGITVNNVLPGYTKTRRLDEIIAARVAQTGKSSEETAKGMLTTVPLGRFAGADEIANAVCFLASPAAAYISGINLPVDGGRTSSL